MPSQKLNFFLPYGSLNRVNRSSSAIRRETKLIIILIWLFDLHYVYHGPEAQLGRADPQARTPGIRETSARCSGLR